MDLHDILAKPIQIVKEVLDLESDLEPPSLVSQFVAIKHQLADIQARLDESNRISREKDTVIAKLQKAMAAKAAPRPTAPAFVREEDKPVSGPSVRKPERAVPTEAREATANRRYAPEQAKGLQADLDEEIRLPVVPSYQAATQQIGSVRPCPAARTTLSLAPVAAEPKPSARAAAPAKAEKARPARTRVAARKTSAATQRAAKPKRTARASKPATAKKAKPTRKRVAAKKTGTTTKNAAVKTKAKATAKPKRTSRAGKK